jgi:hypothetical protein
MRWRFSGHASVLAVCMLLPAAPLAAQNLVQNPGFASDLSSWFAFMAFDLTETWTSVDANGDAQSGSIQGTLPASGTFRIPIYASQCVAVLPATAYVFGAKVLLPTATTPANSFATIFVNTYEQAGCAGNPSQNIVAPNVTTLDAWTQTSSTVTTGAAEVSIQIDLRVRADDNTTLISYFDDVYLMPAATTPVRLQSFEVE